MCGRISREVNEQLERMGNELESGVGKAEEWSGNSWRVKWNS